MTSTELLHQIEKACAPFVTAIGSQADRIREVLAPYADKKTLKGREYVAWLGEV